MCVQEEENASQKMSVNVEVQLEKIVKHLYTVLELQVMNEMHALVMEHVYQQTIVNVQWIGLVINVISQNALVFLEMIQVYAAVMALVSKPINVIVKLDGKEIIVVYHCAMGKAQQIHLCVQVMELVLIVMYANASLAGEVMIVALLYMFATEKTMMIHLYVQDEGYANQQINVFVKPIGLVNNANSHVALVFMEMIHKAVADMEIALILMCVNASMDGNMMIVVYHSVME